MRAGAQLAQIILFIVEEVLERWNNQKRRAHRELFPLNDHLFTLMTIVQAGLTEQQRERLTSHLAIRGIPMQNYTFDILRTAVVEIFCAPRSPLDNPSFRPSNQQRTFLVRDYGELEGSTGYWAAADKNGQAGLVNNLKTFSGSMMKPLMSGLPDISKADVD